MTTSPAVPPTTVTKRRGPVAHTPLRRGISPSKVGSSNNSTASTISRRRHQNVQDMEDEDEDGDEDEDNDDEVARFMGQGESQGRGGQELRSRHSRKSDSVSEEEDLDCVQGLLSLSQGNWR